MRRTFVYDWFEAKPLAYSDLYEMDLTTPFPSGSCFSFLDVDEKYSMWK